MVVNGNNAAKKGPAPALQRGPRLTLVPPDCTFLELGERSLVIRLMLSGGRRMKLEWHKPEVKEEEVGLEVTSYASAELDRG
jgi:coenzyme PQQ precursor peptide PqqA